MKDTGEALLSETGIIMPLWVEGGADGRSQRQRENPIMPSCLLPLLAVCVKKSVLQPERENPQPQVLIKSICKVLFALQNKACVL